MNLVLLFQVQWFNVSEERLRLEKEIPTPFDTLRWDYFQYVLKHPIENWNIPTLIPYGGKDNLQPMEIIEAFTDAHHCKLTVSENSEHPFMQPKDTEIVSKWLEANI